MSFNKERSHFSLMKHDNKHVPKGRPYESKKDFTKGRKGFTGAVGFPPEPCFFYSYKRERKQKNKTR